MAAITLRIIWYGALVGCCVAAMGFVTDGNDFHARRAQAVVDTGTITVTNHDEIITRANDEIAAIRADRDRLTAQARASMNLVLDDGNSNNDDVSSFEENIRRYDQDALVAIGVQQKVITDAQAAKLAAQTTTTTGAVADPGIKAVFRQPGNYIKGFDPITFRDAFGLFWVILLEACGSVGGQALLSAQMALTKREEREERSQQGANTKRRRRLIADQRNQQQTTQADLTEDDDTQDDPDEKEAANG